MCMVAVCGSAHARHTMIGHVFMECTSCVSTLWGSGGFSSIDSCVALWSRFALFSGVGGTIAEVGVLRRAVRS